MRKFAVAAFLLLAAPAAAQMQCQPMAGFAKGAAEAGYEFVGQGVDEDGDTNFILWNPDKKTWLMVFVPQQRRDLVCAITGGRDFEKTDPKKGTI